MIIKSVIDELLSVKGMEKKELVKKLGMTTKVFKVHEGNAFKTMRATQLTKMAWILNVPYSFFSNINRYDNFSIGGANGNYKY